MIPLAEVAQALELTHERGAWYAAIQGTIPSRISHNGRTLMRTDFEAHCKAHPLAKNHQVDCLITYSTSDKAKS